MTLEPPVRLALSASSVVLAATLLAAPRADRVQPASLDIAAIERAIGRAGQSGGDVRIEVTALHNHMIHGNPELYFMHFWAHDTPERVAAGLKAALDAMGQGTPAARH